MRLSNLYGSAVFSRKPSSPRPALAKFAIAVIILVAAGGGAISAALSSGTITDISTDAPRMDTLQASPSGYTADYADESLETPSVSFSTAVSGSVGRAVPEPRMQYLVVGGLMCLPLLRRRKDNAR